MSESFNKGGYRDPFSPEEVVAIIEKAKIAEVDEEGYLVDEDLESDLSSAVVDIGKLKYFHLEKEVWPFLESNNEYLMGEAMRTLGYKSRLHVPAFREVAYDIWNNYKDKKSTSRVRCTALSAWCTYYECSYDKKALATLYKVLILDQKINVRLEAYAGILSTCDAFEYYAEMMTIASLVHERSHDYINQNIDWDRVHKLMTQYAPDVKLVDLDDLPKDS